MKNQQKGFVSPLLVMIAMILISGGAIAYFYNGKQSSQSVDVAVNTQTTPETSPVTSSDEVPAVGLVESATKEESIDNLPQVDTSLVSVATKKTKTPIVNIVTGNKMGTRTSVDVCIGATSKWALWTGGTCLRGANIWKTAVLPKYYDTFGNGPYGPVYTQADFNALSALGANLVNISGPGLYSETTPYGLNADAQATIDDVLVMIKNANMFAIITARSGPGYNMDSDAGTPGERHSVWTSQAEQDGWVAMWKYTADRYKDNPIVVGYDLMVEPHSNMLISISDDTSDFYPTYANTLYDWNPLAKRISDAIRQVDTTTPILIAGMDWSRTDWLSALTSNGDSKTVYMAHQYEPSTYTSKPAPYTDTYGTTTGTFTRANLLTIFSYISSFKSSRNVPVGVNEFGVQRYEPNATQFLDDEFGLMESNGLNYAIYDWEPAALVTTDPLYDGFDYRKGTDPANHVDVIPNVLTTVLQKYFQKNTVRPSNWSF